jgi:hypothetical protein
LIRDDRPRAAKKLATCLWTIAMGTKGEYGTKRQLANELWRDVMVRIARESLALVSVAGFVWMMCSVAQLVA